MWVQYSDWRLFIDQWIQQSGKVLERWVKEHEWRYRRILWKVNLEDRMSKMLKIPCSKPQDYTYFLLLAFAKQCVEGDDKCYTILSALVWNVCLDVLCSISMAHKPCHFLCFYNFLFFYIYIHTLLYKNYILCICQWITILAKWRHISMLQYPCLVPRIVPEGICIWILAVYFFIHLLIFIFHQENFSNLFNTKLINLIVSCHVATNSMKIWKIVF